MEQIIKGFLGIFFIIMMTFLIYNFAAASIQSRTADEYLTSVTKEIEEADMSSGVISEAKSEAASQGYTLEVTDLSSGSTENKGRTELTYTYKIPLISFSKDFMITAYIN